jgi:hypothetical protein
LFSHGLHNIRPSTARLHYIAGISARGWGSGFLVDY